ncbi:hypothetical protein P692DRAFT_20341028 [Suillus brevipes Sb2]|nr:hypothetical protein P692DRAFT_20341028 [Suillus brevipes Sb2]
MAQREPAMVAIAAAVKFVYTSIPLLYPQYLIILHLHISFLRHLRYSVHLRDPNTS